MTSSAPISPPRSRALPLWLVIVAGGFITSISFGVRSTFGLFLDPVIETLGTNRGAFGLAIAVQSLVWGFSQPIAGAVSDRFGAPRVLAAGAVLYAFAMWLMSVAASTAVLVLSAGFLVGVAIGAASFAVVLSSIGRMASPEKRPMALGVVTALGSLGQFGMIPLAEWRLEVDGWRTTALLMAFIAASIVLVTPMLKGSAAPEAGSAAAAPVDSQEPIARPLREDLRRAQYSKSYWLVNIGFLVCGFHVTFIATHLKSYAVDLGQTGRSAAIALSLIGLFNVFGSLMAGYFGSRHKNTYLLAGIYGMRAVVIAAYILFPASGGSTIVFGAAIGVLWLATVPLTSAIVTKQFGTTNSGALFGIVFLSHQVGAFVGAWLGGVLADATGSYTLMWWVAIALGVLGMVVHLQVDEGPVGDPPERESVGVIPATGMAAVLLVGVSTMAIAPARSADAAGPVTDDAAFVPAYCHIDLPVS